VCRILRLLDLGSVENGVGSNDNPGAGGGGEKDGKCFWV
jgi:hypothetical protein